MAFWIILESFVTPKLIHTSCRLCLHVISTGFIFCHLVTIFFMDVLSVSFRHLSSAYLLCEDFVIFLFLNLHFSCCHSVQCSVSSEATCLVISLSPWCLFSTLKDKFHQDSIFGMEGTFFIVLLILWIFLGTFHIGCVWPFVRGKLCNCVQHFAPEMYIIFLSLLFFLKSSSLHAICRV